MYARTHITRDEYEYYFRNKLTRYCTISRRSRVPWLFVLSALWRLLWCITVYTHAKTKSICFIHQVIQKFHEYYARYSCNLRRKLLRKNVHEIKNDAYQVKRCQYKYFYFNINSYIHYNNITTLGWFIWMHLLLQNRFILKSSMISTDMIMKILQLSFIKSMVTLSLYSFIKSMVTPCLFFWR